MKKSHNIKNISFEGNDLLLTVDGEEKSFPLHKISSLLEKASSRERNTFEISPSGYGIHWPLLDEDISIDGLIGLTRLPGKKDHITSASKTTPKRTGAHEEAR
jgi:hypothetical protein